MVTYANRIISLTLEQNNIPNNYLSELIDVFSACITVAINDACKGVLSSLFIKFSLPLLENILVLKSPFHENNNGLMPSIEETISAWLMSMFLNSKKNSGANIMLSFMKKESW